MIASSFVLSFAFLLIFHFLFLLVSSVLICAKLCHVIFPFLHRYWSPWSVMHFFLSSAYILPCSERFCFFGNLIHFTDNHAVFCVSQSIHIVSHMASMWHHTGCQVASLVGVIFYHPQTAWLCGYSVGTAGWCGLYGVTKWRHALSCFPFIVASHMIHVQRFGHRTCDPNATDCAL